MNVQLYYKRWCACFIWLYNGHKKNCCAEMEPTHSLRLTDPSFQEMELMDWTGNSLAAPPPPSAQPSCLKSQHLQNRSWNSLTYFALVMKSFRSSSSFSKKWWPEAASVTIVLPETASNKWEEVKAKEGAHKSLWPQLILLLLCLIIIPSSGSGCSRKSK